MHTRAVTKHRKVSSYTERSHAAPMLRLGLTLITAFLISFILMAPHVFASEGSAEAPHPTKSGEGAYVEAIKGNAFELKRAGTVRVKAFVEPVTVQKEMVFEGYRPQVSDMSFSPAPNWSVKGRDLVVSRRGLSGDDAYSMKVDLSREALDIQNHPKFLFSWRHPEQQTPPVIDFEFDIDRDQDGKADLVVKSQYPYDPGRLVPVESLDFKTATFEEKSPVYLVKRLAGLSFDETWRYSTYRGETVIQRRLALPVTETGVLKIVLKPGTQFKGVNLRLDTEGKGKKQRVVYYADLARSEDKGKEAFTVTVDVIETLAKLKLDKNRVWMSEVILNLGDSFDRIRNDRLLDRVEFYQRAGEIWPRPGVSFEQGHSYLAFDIRQALAHRGIAQALITGMRVGVTFGLSPADVLEVRDLLFFDTSRKSIPALADVPDQRLREYELGIWTPPGHFIKNFDVLWWERDIEVAAEKNLRSAWLEKGSPGVSLDGKEISLVKAIGRTVSGDLYFRFQGEAEHFDTSLEIDYSDPHGTKRTLRKSLQRGDWIALGIPGGSVIHEAKVSFAVPVEKHLPRRLDSENTKARSRGKTRSGEKDRSDDRYRTGKGDRTIRIGQVLLMEVRQGILSGFTESAGEISWVRRQAELPMKPRSGSRLLRDPLNEHRFRLPLEPRSKSVWTFSTDKKYHAAKALSVGYDVPVACDCTGSFAAGPEKVEWDFSQERGRKTIPLSPSPDSAGGVLSVACTNYSADAVSIIIENPSLLALGIRETPDALLPDYPLLVDGKAVNLPLDSRDLVEGNWALSGDIALDAGPHTVTMIENPYVKATSLMLEAPSPDHMSHKKEELQGAGQPVLKGLLSKLAKVVLIAVLALVIYRKRAVLTSVLHRPHRVMREMYLFIPEDGLLLLWLAVGSGLYALSFKTHPSGGPNYYYTAGGVSFIIAYVYFTRLVRAWFTRTFQRISEYVYRDRAAPFFAGAIGLLSIVPLLLIAGFTGAAEHLAVMVYYLLVAGVVLEVMDLRKRTKERNEDGRTH